MTNEELRQKYRLLKLVAEEGERTYQALDASGHIVMVHHLPGDSPDTRRLLALLDTLSPADKARIVERVEVDGAPVLVTQFIQGFKTLSTWLQARTQRPYAAPPPPPRRPGDVTAMFGPPAAEQPAQKPGQLPPLEPRTVAADARHPAGPGDVTAVFGAPSAQQPPPTPEPVRPAPPPSRTAAASAEPAPGDFTGLFGAASGTPPTPPPPVHPPDPAPPPVDRTATPPPGDKPSVRWREPTAGREHSDGSSERPVVRWKKDAPLDEPRAAPQAPPPPPPASTPRKGPGEFTRLFGPSGSAPADPGGPPAPPPPPAPRPPAGPGEFTRLFQPERNVGAPPPSSPERGPRDYLQALHTPAAPPGRAMSAGPPAAAPAGPPGEFTRLMAGIPSAPIGGQPGSVPRTVAPTGGAGGLSDFTRIVSGTSAPSRAASPPPEEVPAEAAPTRRSPRLVVLLIALGVVGVMAVAVVLYFALKNP